MMGMVEKGSPMMVVVMVGVVVVIEVVVMVGIGLTCLSYEPPSYDEYMLALYPASPPSYASTTDPSAPPHTTESQNL
jgi:hypothetical protein